MGFGVGDVVKYTDYVNLGYAPRKNDVVCEFYLEPRGVGMKEAAGAVAAESSTGTWTETTTATGYMGNLHATVFEINGHDIKVSYPSVLFEPGNIPNVLSSVAGNVFGMKAVNNLRLNDIRMPSRLVRGFRGPAHGIRGVRKLLGVRDRPLVGTIIKPKLGLRAADHARVAYEAWAGGCDIVKDDENLSSQAFNPFDKRIIETLRARDRAERETGEKKIYLANVTSETTEMTRRAKFVREHGGECVMLDILTAGFAAVQTLRTQRMVLHAHRAGHAAFTKNPRHGISMAVVARMARLAGADLLHAGTAVGKMYETAEDVAKNVAVLKDKLCGLEQTMPVASGGLQQAMVPALVKLFGRDVVIQAGGGIHALGTAAGAAAMRQAVDAAMGNVALAEYAKTHRELRLALRKWGG